MDRVYRGATSPTRTNWQSTAVPLPHGDVSTEGRGVLLPEQSGKLSPDLILPLDHDAIERILPHRFPFLLVDRVMELEFDKRIVGIKNVFAP